MNRPPSPSVRLTRREQEVVEALILHDTSHQIAETLGISHRTVQDHLQHAMQKFAVQSWHRLLLRAIQQQLVTLPPDA